MEKYFAEEFVSSELETQDARKFLVVVSYDITDNKRRGKLAKFLNGYGLRVQKSVFECRLTNRLYEKLVREIPHYAQDDDLVKVYKLTGNALINTWGDMREVIDEDFMII